jgi:hypothetical protein
MPRLLPFDALDGPPVRARWTAILAAALAITAWNTDWIAAWDTTRGLVPAQTERSEWTTADFDTAFDADTFPGDYDGITNPARAHNAQLLTKGVRLDLVWDATLTIATIRVETYTDAFGTGHRLAIALDSTTGDDIGCLNAQLSTFDGTTAIQACSRTDRHPTLHQEAGKWYPDKLFVTQTANLDPADGTALVDYLGLGLQLGDSNETGMWGPNWWSPMMGGQYHDCDDPNLYAVLEDLHLRPEYAIPTEHKGAPDSIVGGPVQVAPAPDSLFVPACVPLSDSWSGDPRTGQSYATEPFVQPLPSALAAWTRYNATKTEPGPLRSIVAFDIRSCDTEPARCSGDDEIAPQTHNGNPVADWMGELLHTDP